MMFRACSLILEERRADGLGGLPPESEHDTVVVE